MIVLDTDHFSEFIKGEESALGRRLAQRLKESGESFCTTIITYEEQLRGWLARIHKHRDPPMQISDYQLLREVLESFEYWIVLDWDLATAEVLADIKSQKTSVGTLDLMIASITLVNQAKLLSRNLTDFERVPGLDVEDWLS